MGTIDRLRRAGAAAVYFILFGIVAGGLSGFLEVLVGLLGSGSFYTSAEFLPLISFYALLWGLAGLLAGLLHALPCLLARSPPPVRAVKIAYSTGIPILVFFVLVGGYLNARYLPGMFSPSSLLFDAVLFAVCAAAGYGIFRVRWKAGRDATDAYLRLRSPLAASVLVFCIVLSLSTYLRVRGVPERRSAKVLPPSDTNVLILLIDALRADHLGCYGYARPTSPAIDGIAAGGVQFMHAYAQASLTKESTASIMTSLYPTTHNVRHLTDGLPPEAPTLMGILKREGYRTAILSANPMVSPLFGFGRGVDFFYCQKDPVLRSTLLGHVTARLGEAFPWMRWIFTVQAVLEEWFPARHGKAATFTGGGAEAMNEALLAWIDRAPDKPFAAYVHYMEPHAPYDPPPPFDERYDPGYDGPEMSWHPPFPTGMLPFVKASPLDERSRTQLIARYDGAIAYADQEIGRLLGALRARGLEKRTLVVVTADHGEEFYDHGGWGHGQSLHEELVHVPLILRHPGGRLQPRKVTEIVQHVDLIPTLLSYLGLKPALSPEALAGRDLVPLLEGDPQSEGDSVALSEVFHGGHSARSLRTERWKIIEVRYGSKKRTLLFDLEKDPGEQRDLAEERPEVRDDLLLTLDRLFERLKARRQDSPETQIDEGTLQRLRSLGYLE